MTHFLALKLLFIREFDLKIEGYSNDYYKIRTSLFLHLAYGESIFTPKLTCEEFKDEDENFDEYAEYDPSYH